MIMAESLSLLEFLKELLTNVQLRDYFAEDPQGALHEYGLDDLSPADVHDALVLAEDNQTADFSRNYDTGHNSVQFTPPPPPAHHSYATPAESHEAAVQYLNNYVTNNYIDDRDTTVDNSINQQIDTHGGDFDQDIDVHSTTASGDGAVAAGGDIEGSTVTTGNDNQVGDGNIRGDGNVAGDNNQAVTGHDNTTSFGSGDATSTDVGGNVNVGDGGAFSSGGNSTVDNTDNSIDHSFNDSSQHSIDHSFNDESDHSDHSDHSSHDSDNDNSDQSDNSSHHAHDVGNVDIHS
jgi:hypothetical protein